MIRLRTFGSVALERDGTPLGGRNTQRRRLALLVILATARKAPVSRDRLLALLWPERHEDKGRHALAQLLYELRRDLGQEITTAGAEDLSLDPDRISSDVGDFDRALEANAYEHAVALYTGAFLEGFFVSDAPGFERWADEQRTRLAAGYLRALAGLACDAERRGDHAAAVEHRRRVAAADPLSARNAMALMEALARSGDRAAAIRHAKVHSALLRAELEAEPDPMVMQLAERLAREPEERSTSHRPEARSDQGSALHLPKSRSLASLGMTVECHPEERSDSHRHPEERSVSHRHPEERSDEGSALHQNLERSPEPEAAAAEAQRRSTPFALLPRPAVELPEAPLLLPRRKSGVLRRARRGMVALGAAALVIVVAVALVQRARSPAAAPRSVVLGEIASPDTVLAMAVREAVRAQLERTPDVLVVSDGAVGEALRLMELSPGERLTEAVADDVALRHGTPLVVVGQVTPVGAGAQIVLRLVDAERGETLASASDWARESGDVVPAVARLSDDLRARATATRVSAPGPLPAVTTASIEALRDYALARAALARMDRQAAITYGEAALVHDSAFALAHYLVGDLLWYVDQERHAEGHLERAYELSGRLPMRERLLVRARYTQIVLDRPDSALTFWRELRAAYPLEPLGYEGSVWADLAVGNFDDAAAAADSALRLDSAAAPQVRNRMEALLALGDTARALQLTRSAGARWPYLQQQVVLAEYEMRGDWRGLQRALDSIAPPVVNGAPNLEMAATRQCLLLSVGRVREAQVYEELVVRHMHAQFAIRAQLFQARAELAWGAPREHAVELLHAAVARLDSTDLSAPANARLAELAAGVAAAAGDDSALAELRRLVMERDAGRRLPSHELALLTLDGAQAFVRGDYATAVRLLERSRPGRFFGRSAGTLVLLEADALSRLGDHERAATLYRQVDSLGGVSDDGDVWLVLRPIAARTLGRDRTV